MYVLLADLCICTYFNCIFTYIGQSKQITKCHRGERKSTTPVKNDQRKVEQFAHQQDGKSRH